jgi:serine/threonine protein kinase
MVSLLDGRFDEDAIQSLVEVALAKHGRIVHRGGGMCGSVYFFDQGENVHPRWVAAKVPRVPREDRRERNQRFLREIEIQHRTFYHRFVCWPFDYQLVYDTPVALFRAMDGDLAQWIPRHEFSIESRLAVLIYLCSALRHCQKRGVICHQDLKPQNILMRDVVSTMRDVSQADVFEFPMLADFGLANAGIELDIAQGARPYMAPEQWLHNVATAESDVFALGVIIFEVMTRGEHPYGGLTREWWPEPIEGNSKKWLRPETWMAWAERGNPITPGQFLIGDVENIARRCMEPSPLERPSLDQIQTDLLSVLSAYDASAGSMASFQVSFADSDPNDGEWPSRDIQLENMRRWLSEIDGAATES